MQRSLDSLSCRASGELVVGCALSLGRPVLMLACCWANFVFTLHLVAQQQCNVAVSVMTLTVCSDHASPMHAVLASRMDSYMPLVCRNW
jgi:hypothetical protein